MNFQNWSNDGAFGNCCPNLGFRTRSRTRIFSVQRSKCSPSVVSIWSNYVFLPGDRKMLEVCFFRVIVSAVSHRPARRSSKLFSYPVSSCLCRKRYQDLYFCRFQRGQNLVVHKSTCSSVFFFCRTESITPIRNCSADTELFDRVNCLEQEFCTL